MHTKLQSKDEDVKKVEKQLSKMVIDKKRNKNMDYDSDYWEFVIEGEDEEMVEEGEGEGEENIEKMGGVFHRILSIDIGIKNLGISVSIANEDFMLREILFIDLIDITTFVHPEGVKKKDCKLQHTKSVADWLDHIFVFHSMFFDQCDYILIERQPPLGLVAVEQLIFSKYRNKAFLVHPCSMHKYFRIGNLDYEGRKNETEKICLMHLGSEALVEKYNNYNRKHDIADSVCLMLFWLYQARIKYEEEKRREKERNIKLTMIGSNMTMNEWFDQFRYIPRDYF
jgi:hypothetical protein